MQYRILGRTGYEVSVLGFGAMRLPMKGDEVDRDKSTPMIHRAFEAGVNYIDTAVFYCNDDSQRAVGEAIKGWRDKIVLSTKNHHYDKNDKAGWWRNLNNSLDRLDVEVIDIYNFHGLTWEKFEQQLKGPDGLYREAVKAYDQGLIKHICFSFHDNVDNLIKLIDTDLFSSVTCQYNVLDRSNEKGILHAFKKDVGVVIMGPVGGGRLGETGGELAKALPEDVSSTPELALRFVLANPNVTVALSGMSTMQQVEENIATASNEEPLSSVEIKAIDQAVENLKEMADLYCTGCGYCKPCPQGVAIPDIFRHVNLLKVYGAEQVAKEWYANLIKKDKEDAQPASSCVECGQCEPKCPQNIEIIKQLKEAHKILTA